ncbi:hypothetical protein BDQ12DRAFT_76953 [Crucibulum laeve]|uniref:Uncharacterized protein n=1 Tax=Crucibulum laeve TaxID=68775 RepID=A0A5C3M637_9AGAR|nr:hypothetical protein BDQ12DRAFT_76953 [Crucibulum laeve]
MKAFTTLVVASLAAAANAWIFTACGQQFDGGDNNRGCTAKSCPAGSTIDYQVGLFSSCTLRVFSDGSCQNQVGISSNDWDNHVLGQSIGSFSVQDC